MAAAGVASPGEGPSPADKDRLPWLDEYREPKADRGLGWAGAGLGALAVTAMAGGLYLAVAPTGKPPTVAQSTSHGVSDPIVAPTPQVAPPSDAAGERDDPPALRRLAEAKASTPTSATARRARRIHSADDTRERFDTVMAQQQEAMAADPSPALAMAETLAAIPARSEYHLDHPAPVSRPVVNPSARVQKRQTVRMGVYLTATQAEVAWKAAVRDYTYLVTMPKQVAPVTYRGKRYWQLNLGTPSRNHAVQLCRNLKSIGHACSVA